MSLDFENLIKAESANCTAGSRLGSLKLCELCFVTRTLWETSVALSGFMTWTTSRILQQTGSPLQRILMPAHGNTSKMCRYCS